MALPKTTRKKKVRAAPRVKRGGKLSGPSWDGWEEWTGQEIHRHREVCRSFYYENFKSTDLYEFIFQWMTESKEYTKEQIKQAKAAPSYILSISAGISCKQLMDGAPNYNEKENEYWESLTGTMGSKKPLTDFIKKRVEEAILAGSKVVEVKKKEEKANENVYVPTIQERLREAAMSLMGPIDDQIELFVEDHEKFDPKALDVLKDFRTNQVKPAHARIIKNHLEPIYKEYTELTNFPTKAKLDKMSDLEQDLWNQLKEGYAHLSKKSIKNIMTFLQDAIGACDMIMQEGKVTRKPRKPKAINKEKLVAKMKYKRTDEDLKMVSIDPVDIIGANELWVYNIKTRKIGKYVAANIDPTGAGRPGSGLNVKGTTVIGFNEEESIQKTLRKPKEQLAEFYACGKVKLRKYLDEIKTTDIKLNGRINLDTVLLKIQ